MSFLFSPYLSQILTELLKFLISLQRIKISIYVCNVHEVIFFLFGMINFTTKDQMQLVGTGFFHVVDWLWPVFKGPVAVPWYFELVKTSFDCQLPHFEVKKWTWLDFTKIVRYIYHLYKIFYSFENIFISFCPKNTILDVFWRVIIRVQKASLNWQDRFTTTGLFAVF